MLQAELDLLYLSGFASGGFLSDIALLINKVYHIFEKNAI